MKYYLLLSGIFVAACLSGCSDEMTDNGKVVENPVQEGEEILFGSNVTGDALEADINTRTVYGNRTKTGVPVYWKEEGDEIAIFCAQASLPADKLVTYLVKPQNGDKAVSESVTKVNTEEAGLQWGTQDEHRFYAFYPASAVKGSEEENQTGKITANIPVNQQVTGWREGVLDGKKTYFGEPNMNYAYMYAYTSQKKSETPVGTPIDLQFKNLVTVLDITLQGPTAGDPVEISNINVTAVDGENIILTGDFTCDIRTATDNSEEVTAVCKAAGDLQAIRNNISISCYDPKTGKGKMLGVDEQLNVKAYLIPDEEHKIGKRQLQISVVPTYGAAKRRTLEQGTVTPYKINRVRLAHMELGGTNYWMSNIPGNVYLSELSIPGSKFSYLYGDNTSGAAFQNYDISTQFKDGVRAFIVQTDAEATYNGERYYEFPSIKYRYTYQSGSGKMPILNGGGATLSDAIKLIAAELEMAEKSKGYTHEYAVVMVTYNGNDTRANFTGELPSVIPPDNEDVGGKEKIWMDVINNEFEKLAEVETNRIFKGEITANTTLEEVSGKIILKINTNSDAQHGYITADANIPAMFSRWNGNKNTVDLRWGSPNPASARTPLKWMYQEATHVGNGTEITTTDKWQFIQDVGKESVIAYQQNSAHDTWFMNDCGGTFHGDVSGTNDYDGSYGNGDTNKEAPIKLTQWLIPKVTEWMQTRTENAAMGLIFFNFADKQKGSGQDYGTGFLIQTVIDNNFKFNLRAKPSNGLNSGEISLGNGGDVWD